MSPIGIKKGKVWSIIDPILKKGNNISKIFHNQKHYMCYNSIKILITKNHLKWKILFTVSVINSTRINILRSNEL